MNVFFRVDASAEIGAGHLMRCLTLADHLRARGATCIFISRAHAGHRAMLCEARGFALKLLPLRVDAQDVGDDPIAGPYAGWLGASALDDAAQTVQALVGTADWIVSDHYGVDVQWERAVRPFCRRLMVLDDLPQGRHECDVLLNQSLLADVMPSALHPSARVTLALIGPEFALLRPEFASAWEQQRVRQAPVKRILIAFGGTALGDLVELSLQACLRVWPEARMDVVLGGGCGQSDGVAHLAGAHAAIELHVDSQEIGKLMMLADFSMGAAGMMTWERCATGLPAAVVLLAENQAAIAHYAQAKGAAINAGWARQLGLPGLTSLLEGVRDAPPCLERMSRAALSISDGQGVGRVGSAMETLN